MTMAKPRRSRRSDARKANSIGLWLVGGAVLVVVLVVFLVMRSQQVAPADPGAYAEYEAAWLNGRVFGNPDAPVTVQVWDDFL